MISRIDIFLMVYLSVCYSSVKSEDFLTLLSSQQGDYCITNSTSAMYYTDDKDEMVSATRIIPPINTYCDFNYTCNGYFKDWSIVTSREHENLPIFDLRWESLPVDKITPEKNRSIYSTTSSSDFTVYISFRSNSISFILARDRQSNTYELILTKLKIILRKCLEGACSHLAVRPSNINMGLNTWSHISISRQKKAYVVNNLFNGESLLRHTFERDIDGKMELSAHAEETSYVKVHEYTYLRIEKESSVPYYSPLSLNNGEVCTSVFISTCRYCSITLTYLYFNGEDWQDLEHKNLDPSFGSWTHHQFSLSNVDKKIKQVYFQISTRFNSPRTRSSETYWSIDNFRTCSKEEFRITTNQRNLIDCTLVRDGLKTSRQKKTNYIPRELCKSPDQFGEACISCDILTHDSIKSCPKFKICDGSLQKSKCYCASGYADDDCKDECISGFYGYGCRESCGYCKNGKPCDKRNGFCKGCNDLFEGNTCHEPKTGSLLLNPPEVVESRANSCTIQLADTSSRGKNKPKFFIIQYQEFNPRSKGRRNWLDGSKTETIEIGTPITVEHLRKNSNYAIRILVSSDEKRIKELEEVAKVPFAICNTTCDGLNSEDIKIIPGEKNATITTIVTETTCEVDTYRWKLFEGREEKNEDVLQTNFLIDYLVGYRNYTIEFSGSTNFSKTFQTLDGVPGEIERLRIKYITADTITLEWKEPTDPSGIIVNYKILYRKLRGKSCDRDEEHSKWFTQITNETFITITGLKPYSRYLVLVYVLNRNHESITGEQIIVETKHLEIVFPEENLEQIKIMYENTNETSARFRVSLNCSKLLGPLTISVEYNCLTEYCVHKNNISEIPFEEIGSPIQLTNLQPYCEYDSWLSVRRFEYTIEVAPFEVVFNTTTSTPNNITDLLVTAKGKDYISLRWLPPYPPTGKLSWYKITLTCCRRLDIIERFAPGSCSMWPEYHCVTIEKGINAYKFYNLKIKAANEDNRFSFVGSIDNVKTVEEFPQPPYDVSAKCVDNQYIKASWKYPNVTNGNLRRFSLGVKIQGGMDLSFPVSVGNKSTLLYSALLNVKCPYSKRINVLFISENNYNISRPALFTVNSYPSVPVLSNDSLTTWSLSKTSLCVSLNVTRNIKDDAASCYLLILASDTVPDENVEKLEELLKINLMQASPDQHLRLSAEIQVPTSHQNEILNVTIGDAMKYESELLNTKIISKPLDRESINITIVLVNVFGNNRRHFMFFRTVLPDTLGHQGDENREESGSGLMYAIFVLLILVPSVLGVVFCRKRITLAKWTGSLERIVDITGRNTTPAGISEEDITVDPNSSIKLIKRSTMKVKPMVKAKKTTNPPNPPVEIYSKVVTITNLVDYIRLGIESGEFDEQHALFPRGQNQPCQYGSLVQNKPKNRYSNLVAYDHTRVVLEKIPGDEFSDYINANYIDGYKIDRAYIATQGPKFSTLKDFWRMIWQENVRHIVMVANVIEGGKKKVEQYWPQINEELVFEDISVQYSSVEISADYEYRIFDVSRENEKRKLHQYHFTSWPDHGVPMYPQSLVPFVRMILKIPLSAKSPILVHCSAGVGRTGTILLCDINLRMVAKEGSIDMLNHLQKLREQRSNMVDNNVQYKLAHLVILECLMGLNTSVKCDEDFEKSVNRIMEKRDYTTQIKYLTETEWQDRATQSILDYPEDLPNYPAKNRVQDIVPGVIGRIYLRLHPLDDQSSSYINAVEVDGFRCSGQFIVTQQPMPNTLGDFWRLVVEQKVSVIISLNEIDLADETCCNFWPLAEDEKFEPVDIVSVQFRKVVQILQYYNIYSLSVLVKRDRTVENMKVEVVAFKNWPARQSLPPSCEEFLSFWEEASAISRSSKVIVTCFDGALASGLYLALSFLIEKMKLERECDVCLAVRNIRHNRKQFVTEESQFIFLYEAAVKYINGFQSYANFQHQ